MFDPDPARGERPHIAAIDGLRGWAVLWIVLGHSLASRTTTFGAPGSPVKYLIGSFYMGVDVLFVVSGFVLFLPVAREGSIPDRKNFAVRRLARIVPGFYVFLVVSYFVARYEQLGHLGVRTWLAHLFFLHQETVGIAQTGFGVDKAMWTMSVEVVFYVLLLFLAERFYRHPIRWIGIAAATSISWVTVTRHVDLVVPGLNPAAKLDLSDRMARSFPAYALHFALGMGAALLCVRMIERGGQVELRRSANVMAASAVVGLAAIAQWNALLPGHGVPGTIWWQDSVIGRSILAGGLVMAVASSTGIARFIVTNTLARGLGRFSYGIYLAHMPVLYLFSRGARPLPPLELAAVAVGLSVAAGIVSALVIEEPIRRFVRSRPVRPKRVPADVARDAVLSSA